MAEYYNGLTCRLKFGNVPLGHVLDPQLEPSLKTDACPVESRPLNAPPNWIGDDKELLIFADNMLSIITHDRPPPNPNRIYAPIRHRKLASLVASYPNGETE